ncbi:hypothetical protein BX600DRAFT_548976 [Xylariales sp. PMI_506]|nr:hypothetical protein BX600DRAFT_548976 [Xylariales sp. PMI_506]
MKPNNYAFLSILKPWAIIILNWTGILTPPFPRGPQRSLWPHYQYRTGVAESFQNECSWHSKMSYSSLRFTDISNDNRNPSSIIFQISRFPSLLKVDMIMKKTRYNRNVIKNRVAKPSRPMSKTAQAARSARLHKELRQQDAAENSNSASADVEMQDTHKNDTTNGDTMAGSQYQHQSKDSGATQEARPIDDVSQDTSVEGPQIIEASTQNVEANHRNVETNTQDPSAIPSSEERRSVQQPLKTRKRPFEDISQDTSVEAPKRRHVKGPQIIEASTQTSKQTHRIPQLSH